MMRAMRRIARLALWLWLALLPALALAQVRRPPPLRAVRSPAATPTPHRWPNCAPRVERMPESVASSRRRSGGMFEQLAEIGAQADKFVARAPASCAT